MNTGVDVAVVGAGPIGLAAALLMSRSGIAPARLLVIDRRVPASAIDLGGIEHQRVAAMRWDVCVPHLHAFVRRRTHARHVVPGAGDAQDLFAGARQREYTQVHG